MSDSFFRILPFLTSPTAVTFYLIVLVLAALWRSSRVRAFLTSPANVTIYIIAIFVLTIAALWNEIPGFTGVIGTGKACPVTPPDGPFRSCSPSFSFLLPSTWLPVELPCEILWARRHLFYVCLDRFNIWECAALVQTVLIAMVMLFETGSKGVAVAFAFLIAGLILPTFALTVSNEWQLRLLFTISFLFVLLMVDWIGYKLESPGYQKTVLRRTVAMADWPIFLSNAIIMAFLFSGDNIESRIFFAGATAFGLIFANTVIIVIRFGDLHARWTGVRENHDSYWRTAWRLFGVISCANTSSNRTM
jgi:hypothetical protein